MGSLRKDEVVLQPLPVLMRRGSTSNATSALASTTGQSMANKAMQPKH